MFAPFSSSTTRSVCSGRVGTSGLGWISDVVESCGINALSSGFETGSSGEGISTTLVVSVGSGGAFSSAKAGENMAALIMSASKTEDINERNKFRYFMLAPWGKEKKVYKYVFLL